jgi:uncharacterized protein YneF (UPF0154 family)
MKKSNKLTVYIVIAMVAGAILGYFIHESKDQAMIDGFAKNVKLLTTIFLRLVQSKFIKNSEYPICKKCIYYQEDINFPNDYQLAKCLLFGTQKSTRFLLYKEYFKKFTDEIANIFRSDGAL